MKNTLASLLATIALLTTALPALADSVDQARQLLCDNHTRGCEIVAEPGIISVGPMAKAAFVAQASIRGIQLDAKTLAWSPADIAIVLEHEAQHVRDFRAAVPYGCNMYEQRAVRAQLVAFNTLFPTQVSYGPGGIEGFSRDLDASSEEETMSRMFAEGGISAGLINLYWGC